jgi:hypothetical protein
MQVGLGLSNAVQFVDRTIEARGARIDGVQRQPSDKRDQ